MKRLEVLVGRCYGNIKVIRILYFMKSAVTWHYCLCQCDCGKEFIAPVHKVARGSIQSCGCQSWEGAKLVPAFASENSWKYHGTKQPLTELYDIYNCSTGKYYMVVEKDNLYVNHNIEGQIYNNRFYVTATDKTVKLGKDRVAKSYRMVLCKCGNIYNDHEATMCSECWKESAQYLAYQRELAKKAAMERRREERMAKGGYQTGGYRSRLSGYTATSTFAKIADAYTDYQLTDEWN